MEKNIVKISQAALHSLVGLVNLKSPKVIGITKSDQGWRLQVEVIEKESIPSSMDILGIYEVDLDANGEVLAFERKKLRRRSDIDETA